MPGGGTSTTGHVVRFLADGTEYTFAVRAENRYGWGPASNRATATTQPAPDDGSAAPAPGDRLPDLEIDALATGTERSETNDEPTGLWSDGTTLWVSDSLDNKLYAYLLDGGGREAPHDIAEAAAGAPTGLWSDGTTLWVASALGGATAHVLATRARDADKDLATLGGANAAGLWSDGETAWVSYSTGGRSLQAFALATGARMPARDIPLDAANSGPAGIWSDGQTMWVVDKGASELLAYAMSNGARDPERDFDALADAGNSSPYGIWSDGTTMWVTDRAEDKVFAYATFPASTSADLRSLTVSAGTLAFSADVTEYAVTVGSTHDTVTIEAVAEDVGAAVVISPADADTVLGDHQVDLAGLAATVSVVVTARDGSERTYSVALTRTPSDDASLATLSIDGVELGFDGGTTTYAATVAYPVSSLTFRAAASHHAADAVFSGADADAEADGHQVALPVGPTTVTATVTAEDGTTRTYTVTVTREAPSTDATLATFTLTDAAGTALDFGFTAATTSYTVSVVYKTDVLTVSAAAADGKASLALAPADADDAVDGRQVDLPVGTKTISATVTAEDGTTTRTYSVAVTRPAASDDSSLASLSVWPVDDIVFEAGATAYAAEVANTVGRVTVRAAASHTGATVDIAPTDANAGADGHQVRLTVGTRVITLTVTAEDGTATAHTVTLTRAAAVAGLPHDMTPIDILRRLHDDSIGSVEQFVEALPTGHKRGVALVYESDALFREHVSGELPRVVSWAGDGRLLLSWSTDPDSPGHDQVEFLRQAETRWVGGVVDFSAAEPAVEESRQCAGCHDGGLTKPLWGSWSAYAGTEFGVFDFQNAGSTPEKARLVELTRAAGESAHPRLEPLELGELGEHAHYRDVLLKGSGGRRLKPWAVPELGSVLVWRHDLVLFGTLRKRSDYAEIAQAIVCAQSPPTKFASYFDVGQFRMSHGGGRAVQGSWGSRFESIYSFTGDAGAFLVLHDLWRRDARVAAALAGQHSRLERGERIYFNVSSEAGVSARAEESDFVNNLIKAPGSGLRAACAVLREHGASFAEADDPAVAGFTLVDASDGSALAQVAEGTVVDLSGLVTSAVTVQADTTGTVGSVRLEFERATRGLSLGRTDGSTPFTLHDTASDDETLTSLALAAGEYYVSATPYVEAGLGGAMGHTRTARFSVVDGALSSDASLSAMSLTGIPISFESATKAYSLTAGHDLSSTTLTATSTDADAARASNADAPAVFVRPGRPLGSGRHEVALDVGANEVVVTVVAEDGTTQTYTLQIERAAATPASADEPADRVGSASTLEEAGAGASVRREVPVPGGIGATRYNAALAEETAWLFGPAGVRDAALRSELAARLGRADGATLTRGDLRTLGAVDAPEAGIVNLAGLEQAVALRELRLPDNGLADIGALAGLDGLRRIDLRGNAIEDLSPLAGLSAVTHLDLADNGLSDIQALAGISALRVLDLGGNQIADLGPLAGLGELQVLRAGANLVVEVRPLGGLAHLTTLVLRDNAVSDVFHLSALAGLEYLDLAGNAIAEVWPLAGLTRLRVLDLRDNAVVDVFPLSHLEGLRELHLGGNAVTDLTPLAALTGLAGLDLRGNGVVDVQALSSLGGLERLDLRGNRIEDVAPLAALTGLAGLDLRGNGVADVQALSSLAGLAWLDLRGNRVEDAAPLAALTGLVWLDVGGNRVTDFSPLDPLVADGLMLVGRDEQAPAEPAADAGTEED